MRTRILCTCLAAAAIAAASPARALSPEVEELMKVRERLAAARCEQDRLYDAAFQAERRKDDAARRKFLEEAERLASDPELAAATKRNLELTHGKFYKGEEARALRAQTLRLKECPQK